MSAKRDKAKRKHNERDNSTCSPAGRVTSDHKQVPWIRFHFVVARVMANKHARASDNVTDHFLSLALMLPSLWQSLLHQLLAPVSHLSATLKQNWSCNTCKTKFVSLTGNDSAMKTFSGSCLRDVSTLWWKQFSFTPRPLCASIHWAGGQKKTPHAAAKLWRRKIPLLLFRVL